MKNKILFILMMISLVALPSFSSAQATNVRERIEAKRESIQQEMEQRREEIKNTIEERRQEVANRAQNRFNQFIEKTAERFDAALSRLEILVVRIESRMDKMEERDIDTSEAEELLVIAKEKIDLAKESAALIGSQDENDTDDTASTTTKMLREQFETLKNQLDRAKLDIKAAHAALVDVINSLKPGANKLRQMEAANTENDS